MRVFQLNKAAEDTYAEAQVENVRLTPNIPPQPSPNCSSFLEAGGVPVESRRSAASCRGSASTPQRGFGPAFGQTGTHEAVARPRGVTLHGPRKGIDRPRFITCKEGRSGDCRLPEREGTFHFYEPLRFDISYGDGLLIAKNQDFRTLSYGRNRQELMEDIAADIAELWRAYVEESPDRLTEGALSFRRHLQRRIYRAVGCTWADPGCTPAGS